MKRKPYPSVWKLNRLVQHVNSNTEQTLFRGRYVPARPLGFQSWWERWRVALLVFNGKADAVIWPGDE